MSRPQPSGPSVPLDRLPFLLGVVAVIVTGLVFAAIGLNRVAGQGSPPGVPTPVAQSTPTPTPSSSSSSPSPASLATTTCQGVHFGAALQPRDQPADVHKYAAAPATQIDASKLYEATIATAKGTMVVCLQPSLAPATVNNFVVLARNHFFDGLTFHRVEAGFVIQGGDPLGSGSGGPGYQFADEPVTGTYTVGTVAMANSGANTNGSQFFVCIGPGCSSLQPKYNLFGHLVSGLDVALRIAKGDVMTSVTVTEQS